MNSTHLVFLYLFVLLLPLGLSWSLGFPPRSFHQEIASGLGILGFSIILVEFVLSGRFKSISSGTGMDVTMRIHQVMARTALIFAVLHPLFYQGTLSGGQRPWDVTRQLTITTDFPVLASGVLAYMLLCAVIALAMTRNALGYKYETWRLMHGVGGLVIVGLVLHHAIYAGRYSAQPVMIYLWFSMAGIAAGSLVFVYFIEPLRQLRKKWRVVSVNQLTPKQWELRLIPEGHEGLAFKAGQFAWLNVGHSAFSLYENPFSISSAPAGGPEISFVIKELGDFSRSLGQISPGTRAYLDGPHGNLTVDNRTEPGIVLVAGGVGIAPMLSILRQNRLTQDPREILVIYGNRRQDQIVCRNELTDAGSVFVLSQAPEDWHGESGRIDGPLLDRTLLPDQYENWLFVLCGPAAMMDAVEDYLVARGTPSHRILSERFDYD